jgi:L-threonylcarbamoyladenylate synthase
VPNHPIALAVLSAFGGGVAAPSANQFGAVSPTSAAHVLADLGERLDPHRDVIIDGGDSSVGVESTIIDCTGPQPRILRPGAITLSDIERVTGLSVSAFGEEIKAPGTLDSHYSPEATVRLVDSAEQLEEVVAALAHSQFVGVLAPEVVQTPRGAIRLSMPQSNLQYAEELYAALREADRLGLAHVVALLPSGDDIAIAVRDRLTRAAHG